MTTQILVADPSDAKLNDMHVWIDQHCKAPVKITLVQIEHAPFGLVVEYLFEDPAEAITFQLKYR